MIITQKKAVVETTAQSKTKRSYYINILTHSFNLVKKKVKQIVRSFRNEVSNATIRHFQEISDPDGRQLQVTRIDALVSIVDAKGNMVRFSGYLVPELREGLLAVEKNTQGRAIR